MAHESYISSLMANRSCDEEAAALSRLRREVDAEQRQRGAPTPRAVPDDYQLSRPARFRRRLKSCAGSIPAASTPHFRGSFDGSCSASPDRATLVRCGRVQPVRGLRPARRAQPRRCTPVSCRAVSGASRLGGPQRRARSLEGTYSRTRAGAGGARTSEPQPACRRGAPFATAPGPRPAASDPCASALACPPRPSVRARP